MTTQNQLVVLPAAELVRQSTDIAGLCKEIVVKTAMEIQGRKYVKVEGWQSIATAHGCLASSRDVERVEGGYKAIGEVRRMADGALLAQAEGFVGEDEPTWFGGETQTRDGIKKHPKRPDYAIRAMCQTRAISRACRSAFAHVVVLMDAGLSTTPAEEVPSGGFQDDRQGTQGRLAGSGEPESAWRSVKVHFGKIGGPLKGKTLGELDRNSLDYLRSTQEEKAKKGTKNMNRTDRNLYLALQKEFAERDGTNPTSRDETGAQGKQLAALSASLEHAKISQDDFMRAAKALGWFKPDCGPYSGIPENVAERYVDDFSNVLEDIAAFLTSDPSGQTHSND